MTSNSSQPITKTFSIGGDLTINRLGYGAMRLTGQPSNFGPYPDWEGGKALLQQAISLGVNFIDTAEAYGPGNNEDIIADALYPYAEDLAIATKGGIFYCATVEIGEQATAVVGNSENRVRQVAHRNRHEQGCQKAKKGAQVDLVLKRAISSARSHPLIPEESVYECERTGIDPGNIVINS